MTQLEELVQEKNNHHTRRQRATSILLVLSLLVTSTVFYNLRLTGITLAGDAHCGIEEHQHKDTCYEYILTCPIPETEEPTNTNEADKTSAVPHKHSQENGCFQKKLICNMQEHTHDLTCYSNDEADVETPAVWESTFAGISTKNRIEALVEIAKTQVGYKESDVNFRTTNGEKRGYTRYGAWYGSPYGKWSTMFTSFCLSYAGFETEETPYAQGGESMQGLWNDKGLYKSKETYTGQVGDIVFFDDNLTGIICKRMPDYIHVIVGDVENQVQMMEVFIGEADILGYGVIPREIENNPYHLTPLTITVSATPKEEQMKRRSTFSLRSESKNIKDYLEGIGGSFDFKLLNADKTPIVPDENGNVTLNPKTEYLVSLTMHTGEHGGIIPGEYKYNLPDGVITAADQGDIIMPDGTLLGTWQIDETGHISFFFNDNINRYGDVLLNVTTGVIFPPDVKIELDGNIHVTVRPEEGEDTNLLNVTKWGRGVRTDEQGNLIDGNGNSYNHHKLPWGDPLFTGADYERIYWDVYITGNKEDALTGYVITDQITSPGTHYYSPKDMEAGVVIKYYGAKLNHDELHWILLKPGTPGFEWTQTGFRYTMPHTLMCDDPNCSYKNEWNNPNNDPITIEGNWVANIDYFSTLKPATENGWNNYTNKIYVHDKVSNGLLGQTVSTANASIQKDGVFNGHTGNFRWMISVNIPKQSDEYRTTPWSLMDLTKLSLNDTTAFDFDGAFYERVEKITATIGNKEYDVPYILDVKQGERPPLAYCFGYVSNGPVTSMVMYLLRPCNCTGTDNCETWGKVGNTPAEQERCHSGDIWVGANLVNRDFGYCRCWNVDDNVRLLIEYSSPGEPVIERSKNQKGDYINIINLYHNDFKYDNNWAEDNLILNDTDTAVVPVPSVFDKVLTADPNKENSYIASYTITVNESKVDLSMEESIRIEDTMSNTLVYIPGSLVVQTEDSAGVTSQLVYGKDYTLMVGEAGNKLEIEIFNPGALKYTFNYDCRITVPPGQTSLMFDNSAKISLFGKVFEDKQTPQQVTNVAVSAASYSINVQKLDADVNTNIALPGAVIGFFAHNGEKILEYTTDQSGMLTFSTDITKGVIIREHTLYYIEELRAPDGYMLDNTRHHVFLCDNTGPPCEKCEAIATLEHGEGAIRVENGKPGNITLYNQRAGPLFPETGGTGPLIFYIIGLILIISPCIYIICSKRRRKERRFRSRPLTFTAKNRMCRKE